MLYDTGLVTEEQRKIIDGNFPHGGWKYVGCIDRRICNGCQHVIVDSVCFCLPYFICPSCGFENEEWVKELAKLPIQVSPTTTSYDGVLLPSGE